MIQNLKLFLAGLAFFSFCFAGMPVIAGGQVQTDVRVIHAAQGPHHIDSGIRDLASELESVFRYTSYSLIQTSRMSLGLNQKGGVNLPGDRRLLVSPTDISGGRIQYEISILKSKKTIFQTQILLNNQSSITIGGPQYNNGYLLFNISGQVQ